LDVTGIIIRSVDYGEKDKIIAIATAAGVISVKCKGVRSPSSKLKGAVSVLTFGEFSVAEGKGGYTLTGGNVVDSFFDCWSDAEKYAAAMSCLEIFDKCASRGGEPSVVELLKAIKNITYGLFSPAAEGLRYAVIAAAEAGMDVTEKVFNDETSGIFAALLKSDTAESVLTECTQEDVKNLFRRLAAGFLSELGIKITVFSRI